MNHIIIKFPFSSVNDEQYELALCMHAPVAMTNITAILNADSEVFQLISEESSGKETIHTYIGTLAGSVIASDDERSDLFEAMASSKLQFNMACQTFPEWLMPLCDLRWVSVILYKIDNRINYEMWRGYLIGQSLNMTVVRNIMACSMAAVDEVGMAKYTLLKGTIGEGVHHMTIYELVKRYHTLHHTEGYTMNGINGVGFDQYYKMLNLYHSGRLLWHRNLAYLDESSNEVRNLPQQLNVNLDRWLLDEQTTWDDVFDAIFSYLNVTFSIGSWGLMTVCDGYMLTCPTDSPTIQQYVYVFANDSFDTQSVSVFEELSNPTKIGGDLNVTTLPARYKSVTVQSTPERWKAHTYLSDDDYPAVDPTKFVKHRFGPTIDIAIDPTIGFNSLAYHKLIYLTPKSDEEQYVKILPCVKGEGAIMAANGDLPYDSLTSCDNIDHPTSEVANSLDFITFMEGACVVKIGQFEFDGVDENTKLKNYFLILNHWWGNMYDRKDLHTMQNPHVGDAEWLTFTSLGNVAALHPGERHWLKIGFKAMFIRENMSSDAYLAQPATIANPVKKRIDWTTPAILLPQDKTYYEKFDDPQSPYYAHLDNWTLMGFYCMLCVGDLYYNGSYWQNVGQGDTPPRFFMSLWSDNTELGNPDFLGEYDPSVKNYYYCASNPFNNNTVDPYSFRLIDLSTLSIHNSPVDGQLKLTILGQIQVFNPSFTNNSIPFVLISDVDITYTDDAEIAGISIENDTKVWIDANSTTREEMNRSIVMATPSQPGFYNNCLLYDGGKTWRNLSGVVVQGGNIISTPEKNLAAKLASQLANGQCYVELSTPIRFDDNLHNINFSVKHLTEVEGVFSPVKRDYDYTLERLRMKLIRNV